MPDAGTTERHIPPFAQVLQQIGKGAAHNRLSEALAELTAAVKVHDKAGSLTVTVKVEPTKGTEMITVSVTSTARLPQETTAAMFFANDDGALSRDNPEQPTLPLRDVSVSKETA